MRTLNLRSFSSGDDKWACALKQMVQDMEALMSERSKMVVGRLFLRMEKKDVVSDLWECSLLGVKGEYRQTQGPRYTGIVTDEKRDGFLSVGCEPRRYNEKKNQQKWISQK